MSGNCSIVGGYVHRRATPRALRGRYVYGDFCSGRIWSARLDGTRLRGIRLERPRVRNLVSFGVDAAGNLYAVAISGAVYRFA